MDDLDIDVKAGSGAGSHTDEWGKCLAARPTHAHAPEKSCVKAEARGEHFRTQSELLLAGSSILSGC